MRLKGLENTTGHHIPACRNSRLKKENYEAWFFGVNRDKKLGGQKTVPRDRKKTGTVKQDPKHPLPDFCHSHYSPRARGTSGQATAIDFHNVRRIPSLYDIILPLQTRRSKGQSWQRHAGSAPHIGGGQGLAQPRPHRSINI